MLHLDFKQYLEAKGISLPALYTMEWCQERRAWIGCCQDLPEPLAPLRWISPRKSEDLRRGGADET